MAGGLGMLPEQVWDSAPIPSRGLYPGRPTGSAMPLAWAHAEFIKLAVSHHGKRIFDRPEAVWQRYQGLKPDVRCACWTPRAPLAKIGQHQTLLILLPEPALMHIGFNGWQEVHDVPTMPCALDVHWIEIDIGSHDKVRSVEFTWRQVEGAWHGRDHVIAVTTNRHDEASTDRAGPSGNGTSSTAAGTGSGG